MKPSEYRKIQYAYETGSARLQEAMLSLWVLANIDEVIKTIVAYEHDRFELTWMHAYCRAVGHQDFVC